MLYLLNTFPLFFSETPELHLLPLLNYILNKGNTTFYEWKYGKTPDRIEELKLETNQEQQEYDQVHINQ